MSLARLLVPALRWDSGHGFSHLGRSIDDALGAGVGGFLLYGGPRAAAAELCAELHARSAVPLLIAADAESGAGQQFEGCVALPPFGALGFLNDPAGMRRAGQVTARDLRRTGLNWALAPVCDLDFAPGNAIVGTRAAGDDPGGVGALIGEWIDGCQSEGVMACAKHFPGHGRADADSHATLPIVGISAEWLEKDDLAPFRAAVDAGVASVMTAHVAFTALDSTRSPATLSAPILTQLLRGAMEFDGLIVSDALDMRGVLVAGTEAEVAVRAIEAGCDMLLSPLDDEMWSRQAADGAIHLLRGMIPRVGHAVEVVHVDDDASGPWPVPDRAHFVQALGALEVEANVIDMRSTGTRVPVIIAAFADSVAGKAEPGFSHASRDRIERAAAIAKEQKRESLVVLFSHPRHAAQVPEAPNVLCAWGGERPMQAAAARVIARASR